MSSITQSLEDYLESIYMLVEAKHPAQVCNVAQMLSVKMPSVVKAMRELKRLDLVVQEPYGDIKLTTKGRRLARHIMSRHTLLRTFLLNLGVSQRIADRDACRMEHILSAETLDRIRSYNTKNKK